MHANSEQLFLVQIVFDPNFGSDLIQNIVYLHPNTESSLTIVLWLVLNLLLGSLFLVDLLSCMLNFNVGKRKQTNAESVWGHKMLRSVRSPLRSAHARLSRSTIMLPKSVHPVGRNSIKSLICSYVYMHLLSSFLVH